MDFFDHLEPEGQFTRMEDTTVSSTSKATASTSKDNFHVTPKEEANTSAFSQILSTAFDLSPSLQGKLAQCRLRFLANLEIISNEELMERFGFTAAHIEEIDRKIRRGSKIHSGSPIKTIPLGQWQAEMSFIATGCQRLDAVFGGKGLPTGMVTQISGEAGSGKTQFCMQLCFRVQLPLKQGGLNGEVLYIDTEDSFRPERLQQIATNYFRRRKTALSEQIIAFKVEETLTRIHLRKMNTNAEQLLELLSSDDSGDGGGELGAFLDAYANVKLIIIDSVAYHFRYNYDNVQQEVKTHQLTKLAKRLRAIAHRRNIAILITNQVSMDNVPTLGKLWNSVCSTSLLLRRVVDEYSIGYLEAGDEKEADRSAVTVITKRQCKVLKSCSTNSYDQRFYYLLTANGVEDAES